jgi:hypothetical protein
MELIRTDPLVWVKDRSGDRHLCPMGALRNLNTVGEEEKRRCVDHASRLTHPEAVPGEGKIKFGDSRSPN